MTCILSNGEVQDTFTIKDLEKTIRDILSTEEKQITNVRTRTTTKLLPVSLLKVSITNPPH